MLMVLLIKFSRLYQAPGTESTSLSGHDLCACVMLCFLNEHHGILGHMILFFERVFITTMILGIESRGDNVHPANERAQSVVPITQLSAVLTLRSSCGSNERHLSIFQLIIHVAELCLRLMC